MDVAFGEGAREDGEGGVVGAEESQCEWRMYLAESLSISCWRSDPRFEEGHLRKRSEQLTNCSTLSMSYFL